jgi:hypothetical protein
MAIKVNTAGFEHAKKLIQQGNVNIDQEWHLMEPTPESEDAYLASVDGDINRYGRWFLAINTDHTPDTKEHYEFPYGDFSKVCRSGVVAAKQRAAQYHHADVEAAAAKLLDLIDQG